MVVDNEEAKRWADFWKRHLDKLEHTGQASATAIWFAKFTNDPEWIGYQTNEGQIRPGEIGKWDLLEIMRMGRFSDEDCLAVTGLRVEEVIQFHHDMNLQGRAVDSDDPAVLRVGEELERLTPEEIDRTIEMLEAELLKTGS